MDPGHEVHDLFTMGVDYTEAGSFGDGEGVTMCGGDHVSSDLDAVPCIGM